MIVWWDLVCSTLDLLTEGNLFLSYNNNNLVGYRKCIYILRNNEDGV